MIDEIIAEAYMMPFTAQIRGFICMANERVEIIQRERSDCHLL